MPNKVESFRDAAGKLVEVVTAVGFTYWASYLVNGDASGIDDADVEAADKFQAYLRGDAHAIDVTDVSEDNWFGRPDFGSNLAGDCCTYTALLYHE
jgi:hypothetical protein